jgi:hypothetical protein
VRDGDWERLFPRVFLVGGHRLGDEARVRAAWLWAGGEPAAVTGPAAAYGMLERAPAVVDLTVPRGTHRRPQRGIRLRRRDLGFPDLVGIRDLWLADAPLAALETAVALRGRLGVPGPRTAAARPVPGAVPVVLPNLGRHGSSTAGRLITAAADRADSAAERLLVRLLRAAGVTGWVLGHPFGPWRIDLAFPVQKVGGRGGRVGPARGCGEIPQRSTQAERARAGRMGSAAVHVARPRRTP